MTYIDEKLLDQMEKYSEKIEWEAKALEKLDVVRPGNPDKRLAFYPKRGLRLSDLPHVPGKCKWCFSRETKSERSLYCSWDCKTSAHIWCWPQSGWGPKWFLLRQKGACRMCGEILTDHRTHWHVDHVQAIANGGNGIGIDNIQILCEPCHKIKTSDEQRRGYGNKETRD